MNADAPGTCEVWELAIRVVAAVATGILVVQGDPLRGLLGLSFRC